VETGKNEVESEKGKGKKDIGTSGYRAAGCQGSRISGK
jgi:hypothetical protein